MKNLNWLLWVGGLCALRLSAATNVLVSAGALRDGAGNPLPTGALVVLVASTLDNTFTAPPPGAALQAGAVIADDDVVIATWAVDAGTTGVTGGSYRLIKFDYAAMGIPNFGPGDKLMLYWFAGATLINAVALPTTAYGSYRTDSITAGSNISWTAPVDTSGATLGLSFLTDIAGGDQPAASGNATSFVASAAGLPVITTQPVAATTTAGSAAGFSVNATGAGPLSYQWLKGSATVPGATNATLTFTAAQPMDAGSYTVVVTNPIGTVTSNAATLTVGATLDPRGLLAGTVRANVGAGTLLLSGTFTVEGTTTKQMLVRAVGPALSIFSVSGALVDPRLEIYNASTGTLVASNDDWSSAGNANQVATISVQVGAFALGAGSKDAVILASFPPGTYQAKVSGSTGTSGQAQLEIYDADTTPRLVYLAVKGFAGTGTNTLVQGFVVAAPPPGRSYLVRALGPALASVGALVDPAISVYSSSGTILASNDNWAGDATLSTVAANVGALALPPGSKDAAINFVPPAAGVYTAQVSGLGSTSGIVLLEIFEADTNRAAQVPAAIVVQPEPVAVQLGQPAALGIVTVSKPAATFQWRRNSAPIAGATSAIYTLAAAQPGDAGNYDVLISHPSGNVTSATAALNVITFAEHSADTDHNFRIGVLELTRVIELYNARIGTTRTGHYAVQSGTEDGFAPDSITAANITLPLASYHASDTNQDGRISLLELTRVVELYNYRSGTTRTGQYHVQAGTEDGFAPGP